MPQTRDVQESQSKASLARRNTSWQEINIWSTIIKELSLWSRFLCIIMHVQLSLLQLFAESRKAKNIRCDFLHECTACRTLCTNGVIGSLFAGTSSCIRASRIMKFVADVSSSCKKLTENNVFLSRTKNRIDTQKLVKLTKLANLACQVEGVFNVTFHTRQTWQKVQFYNSCDIRYFWGQHANVWL